ncbi:hypothetical protein LOC67_12360 [Stieleria sp. JC731]|uniref:prolyl oligopeptidase family serine peptidase n=1 Tax=Pirellulaceae TaxID=2691357 RepID=UPI001E3CFA9B|nr:prolyl oligopeptidase family serine peptidase [Stieleria sp. JC731]MCC9601340.1 hypothetical protein [Stieleria sp. JC731]
MRISFRFLFVAVAMLASGLHCSEPAQTAEPKFKRLPPDGIEIDQSTHSALTQRLTRLQNKLDQAIANSKDAQLWQADVEVLLRSVRLALEQHLFFKASQTQDADKLLNEAERRIDAASAGTRGLELLGFDASKNDQPQPLVAGFVSRIDDSVQPFGIVVPAGYSDDQIDQPTRMDVWLHGRGDTKTEIPFLVERMTKVGQYAPEKTIVLHPFGRHCNAFKFAGETDVYESIEAAKRFATIDPDRISIRGFSMGGAGCWHMAVHDPSQWFAANPGAGFVDTIVYQGWQDKTPFPITPTMQKLLRWYDVLPWVGNLQGTNVIAYSGEIDKQKQAADRVVEKANELGFEFPYVIGAEMGHKIDPESATKIDNQLASWASSASKPSALPRPEIEFTTFTLRYSQADWVRVTGMREHWTEASVKASVDSDTGSIKAVTSGVTHLEFDFSKSGWSGPAGGVNLDIDGEKAVAVDTGNLRGFQCRLRKVGNEWTLDDDRDSLRKRPGMQGPIDDAFCERFVIVLPSRPARHGRVQRWIDRETEYLQQRWKRLMRGDVQVVTDRELTDDQIATCNLICFGDFTSNRYLFDVADQLPIKWTREKLVVGDQVYDPANYAPVLCCPNPLNPKRYLVINSGMTFREFSNASNSRQIAMLPDYAVIDVTEEDDSITTGSIVQQGFFDEQWKLAP